MVEIGSGDLAAKHCDLVEQYEDLELCGALTMQHQIQNPKRYRRML